MNRNSILFFLLLLAVLFMYGCGVSDLKFQDEVRPKEQVEDMLSDYLEEENPNYKFKVRIYEETD